MLPPPLVPSDTDDRFDNLEAELSSQHFLSSLKLLTGDSAPASPSNQPKSVLVHAYASDLDEASFDQDSIGNIPPPPPPGLVSAGNISAQSSPERKTYKSLIHVNTSYVEPARRKEAVDSITEIILNGMSSEDGVAKGKRMVDVLAKILERLDALASNQERLEAKIDAFNSANTRQHGQTPPSPFIHPYTSYQAPATSTHPSHLSLAAGKHDTHNSHNEQAVNCGWGLTRPGSFGAGSALSTSVEGKLGGGIEALRLARRNSRTHQSTITSSFTAKQTHLGFSPRTPATDNGDQTPELNEITGDSTPRSAESSPALELEDPSVETEMPGNTMWQLDLAAERLKAKESGGKDGIAERKERKLEEVYGRRAILTTYPNQPSVRPYPLQWGIGDARQRGPIICSRQPNSLPYRNAIGAHTGPYSVYRALSVAMKLLPVDHRPDFTDTSPPIAIGPHPSWHQTDSGGIPKIVSMDPFGALAQEIWKKEYSEGLDIRPTISQTKSHLKIPELDTLYQEGKLKIDGKIVVQSPDLPAFPGVHQGIQVATYKISVEPVWFLPGIAARLKVDEGVLRRALFEDTGGMYPELLTRPDLNVYLPPIGGITIYVFGDPAYLSDPTKELTFRPHDECNGSDVFGSDICTCRPYLTHGLFEAVKTAQRGGVGCIAYFRKEGRALGEVTKLLVYNLRKRSGDSAEKYFKSTELIAGIKDQRFQALHLPDVLAYLGITKIDNLISMSDMKYNAMVESGVKVINRYEIPEELMPPDSLVEIHAKIAHGYFSKKKIDEEALKLTKGRGWEDVVH